MKSHQEIDESLLESARRGERDALETLLLEFLPELKTFLRVEIGDRTGGKESIDDLAQSVCADVLSELGGVSFEGPAPFRAWLRKVAFHKAISKYRYWSSEKRDPRREQDTASDSVEPAWLEAVARQTSPSEAAIGHEQAEHLHRALQELEPDDRLVITLARIVGLQHREIAQIMERSEQATRALLRRALVHLSAVLDRGHGPDGGIGNC